jgi:hypothetical protein
MKQIASSFFVTWETLEIRASGGYFWFFVVLVFDNFLVYQVSFVVIFGDLGAMCHFTDIQIDQSFHFAGKSMIFMTDICLHGVIYLFYKAMMLFVNFFEHG